jgi:hypothetical protein
MPAERGESAMRGCAVVLARTCLLTARASESPAAANVASCAGLCANNADNAGYKGCDLSISEELAVASLSDSSFAFPSNHATDQLDDLPTRRGAAGQLAEHPAAHPCC